MHRDHAAEMECFEADAKGDGAGDDPKSALTPGGGEGAFRAIQRRPWSGQRQQAGKCREQIVPRNGQSGTDGGDHKKTPPAHRKSRRISPESPEDKLPEYI